MPPRPAASLSPACLAELRRTASNRAAGVWIHQSRTRKHVHTRRWGGRAADRPAGSVPPARLHSLTPRVQVESEDWIGAGEAVSLRQAVHLRHAVLNQYLEATLDGAVRPLPTFDTRARTRPLDPPCPSFCLLWPARSHDAPHVQVLLSAQRCDATRWVPVLAEPAGGSAVTALTLPNSVHLRHAMTDRYLQLSMGVRSGSRMGLVSPNSSRPSTAAETSKLPSAGRTEAEKEADGVGHTLQLSATARVSDLLTVSLLPSTTELVLLYAQSCQLKEFHPLQPLRADTCLRTVLSRSGACV